MVEERREQQQPDPSASPPQPAASAPPAQPAASAPPPQPDPQQHAYVQAAPGFQHPSPPPPYAVATPAHPSALEVAGRVARLLLGRAIWAGEQGWRLVSPRLGWVMLTGFLVGVIGVLSLMLVLPRLVRSGPAADARVAAIAPAAAVEDFLRGQQTYDADMMWESFSAELRQDLEGREITRDTLAERVESERQAGHRYGGPRYIGGVELAGNQRMYFYVVEMTSPQERGTISFVFTVGSDGKIVSVE